MATAIECPVDGSLDITLTASPDISGVPRYVRADFYFTQEALDEWLAAQFGPVIAGLTVTGGNGPFVYAWDDVFGTGFDTWTDGWTAPTLGGGFTEGWHTFEFFIDSSGGTNRFAVDGVEVTWASTNTDLNFVNLGNDGGPGVEPIWLGLMQVGTAWQTADLYELDGTAIDQTQLEAEAPRIFLGFSNEPFISETPEPPAPPAEEGARFDEAPPWRYVVTGLGSGVLTILDKRAKDRAISRILNQPLTIEGTVASDDPEVNIVTGDGYPFLAEGVRLLYAFRREGTAPNVWVIRAAGIILDLDDNGNPDIPRSRFVAYDPWQLLYRRPVLTGAGSLPDENGISFAGTPGSDVAVELIQRTIDEHGECHLDIASGTIETTDDVEIDFQQGTSVGEALDQLVQTGTMDIVIDPVWDPLIRPGVVGVLNIYDRAGSVKYGQVFAWDKPSKSVVQLDRRREGRERVNRAQYYIGQGGPPVPLESDLGSIGVYGEYWEQQFFPSHQSSVAVQAIADAQVRLRSDGLVTYTMSPAPERSPRPLRDYDIGDIIPIYASDRLREETATLRRVHGIPLVIGDDQLEAPSGILLVEEEGIGS